MATDKSDTAAERISAVLAGAYESESDRRAAVMAARAAEFRSLARPRSITRGRYGVDILQADARRGEVEVYARVFRDGQQLGFGADGSVDVERFVIVNPPILVPDDAGEVVRVVKRKGLDDLERRFRVDLQECLIGALADMIRANGVVGSKIIPGKEGRTTYTVFSSNDGAVASEAASYASARDAASGSGSWTSTDVLVGQEGAVSAYDVYEGLLTFNTSSVLGTISSAVLSLYGSEDRSTAADFTINARRLASSYGTVGTSDWITGGSLSSNTLLATFNTTGWSTSGYNAFTSDGNFITNINQSGSTYIVLSSSRTESNTSPATSSSKEYVVAFSSAASGTSQDPKLVVDATSGPAIPVVMHHLRQQGIA